MLTMTKGVTTMYQVTVKGNTLDELKKAVADVNEELNTGLAVQTDSSVQISKDMSDLDKPVEDVIAEAVASEDGLDSRGLPWDKRIHASTKTKKKDGGWKNKKGVEASLITTVENELKDKMQHAANPPAVPLAPVTESTPVVEQPAHLHVAPTEVVTEPTQVVAPAPVMPAGNGHTLDSFKQNFPMVLASLISEGKVTQDYINQLKTYFNVPEIWNISDEQKKEMFESFVQFGFIQKV